MVESSEPIWRSGAPTVGEMAERSRTVEREDIRRFTEMSGGRNPLPYDEQASQATQFGEIVVQGGVTRAILNAVVAEELPGPPTVFLNVKWDFTAPLRPGDAITGSVEGLDVRDDKPITELSTKITLEDGETVLDWTAACYTLDLAGGVSDR